jgi:hypothetical protein
MNDFKVKHKASRVNGKTGLLAISRYVAGNIWRGPYVTPVYESVSDYV